MSAQLTMPATPELTADAPAEIDAALIKLSGRRHFAAQRVVLSAVLASLGREGAEAGARAALAQLRDAHATLVDGRGSLPGAADGALNGALHEAYFGTLQGDQAVRDFIGVAAQTLDAIGGNGVGAPALLDQLVRGAPSLMSVLNGLTLMLEEQARRRAQARRLRLQGALEQIHALNRRASELAFHARLAAARANPDGDGAAEALTSAVAALATAQDALLAQAQAEVRAL